MDSSVYLYLPPPALCQRADVPSATAPRCSIPGVALRCWRRFNCLKIVRCNCNCLDPHCGLLDCCCIQLRWSSSSPRWSSSSQWWSSWWCWSCQWGVLRTRIFGGVWASKSQSTLSWLPRERLLEKAFRCLDVWRRIIYEKFKYILINGEKKIWMIISMIFRIKRKEVVAKQPEKNGSSWSLSEEGFEHG